MMEHQVGGNGVLSGEQLVHLGITPNPDTELCRCLVQEVFNFRGQRKDDNGVSYLDALDQRWYKRCRTGRQSGMASLDEEQQREQSGLPASKEWEMLEQSQRTGGTERPMLVVCVQRCVVRRSPGVPHQLEWKYGNAYCVLRNEQQLFRLYRHLPPADRFLQEVILPDTPHKCVMDIERDMDTEGKSDTEIRQEMEFMWKGLYEKFIPAVCRWFTAKLQVPVGPGDCYIADSSKLGVKFSVHLTVTTPVIHYFKDRMEAWIAMASMAKYMEEKAVRDPEFSEWYFMRDERNRLVTTWDYGIYNAGARNMRLLGACKGDKKVVHTHWRDCRVFVPVHEQRHEAYHKFIATAYGYPRKTLIRLPPEMIKEAYQYCQDMRARDDSPYWFQVSRGLASRIETAGYVERTRNNGRHRTATRENRPGMIGRMNIDGGNGQGSNLVHEVLHELGNGILSLGREDGRVELFDQEFLQHEMRLKVDFTEAVVDVLGRMSRILHPGNHLDPVDFVNERGVFARATMNAFINGDRGNGRRCYFGCTSGSHKVVLSCRVDFAIEYFCHACSKRGTILPTTIRASRVRPGDTTHLVPSDFRPGVIDYDTVPFNPDAGESDRHMRRIQPLPGGGFLTSKSTIILHGRMGSGKTVATKAYLEAVRREKPSAKIVAISFRKMLASMFASSFELDNYMEFEQRSLFESCGLAIQMESMERLGRPYDGGGNAAARRRDDGAPGSLAMSFHAHYDVIVLDEIESVLAHLSSQTMSDRLASIWKLFSKLVEGCVSLVACDADVGPRTFQFLRMTRGVGVDEGRYIPDLQYHINRFMAIRTKFIDYAGEAEWFETLVQKLLDGKNVFYFSNNKTHMTQVRGCVCNRLQMMCRKRIEFLRANPPPYANPRDPTWVAEDPEVVMFHSIMDKIKIIDADVSESEKKRLTKCNEEWVKLRMVMISPTVGAGIDFNEAHFHVAFGNVTYASCEARAVDQMRGRCRFLIDGECHLYIHDNTSYDLKSETDPELIAEAPRRGLPLTLSAAEYALTLNRQCYSSDMEIVTEMRPNGESYLVARTATIPRELQCMLAMNAATANRSRTCFRKEFIEKLQMGDPDVDYQFLMERDHRKNNWLRENMKKEGMKKHEYRVGAIAAQRDISKDEYVQMTRNDLQGTGELLETETNLKGLLDKNAVKHFYGIKDGIGSEAWSEIIRLAAAPSPASVGGVGTGTIMDCVRNFSYILFANMQMQYVDSTRRGTLKQLDFRMIGDNQDLESEFTVAQRTAQEIWPQNHIVRCWAIRLMYAAGFEIEDMRTLNTGPNPVVLMPSDGLGVASHKGLGSIRLQDPDLQHWLKARALYIMEKSGFSRNKRNMPEDGADWEWKHVSAFTSTFLQNWFNLKCRSSIQTIDEVTGKRKRSREGFSCSGHMDHRTQTQVECSLTRIDPDSFGLMLSLAACHLNAPYMGKIENEPDIRQVARENINRVMGHYNVENKLGGFVNRYQPGPANNSMVAPRAHTERGNQQQQQQEPAENSAHAPEEDNEAWHNPFAGYGDEYGCEDDEAGGYGGYGNDYGFGFDHVGEEDGDENQEEQPQDGNENAPMPQPMEVDQNEDELVRPLKKLKTLHESNMMKSLSMAREARKKDDQNEKAAIDFHRRQIVMRYVGPSPYSLSPTEFAVLMLSNPYQGAISRAILRFEKKHLKALA